MDFVLNETQTSKITPWMYGNIFVKKLNRTIRKKAYSFHLVATQHSTFVIWIKIPIWIVKIVFTNCQILSNICLAKYVIHYGDVTMSAMTSQFTGVWIVYSPFVHTQIRKHQSSASLAFVRGIHRWPVNSPHKRPVTRKMFTFEDVIIWYYNCVTNCRHGTCMGFITTDLDSKTD